MSRQREDDLDEDFEISIGLSDIEKEDEQAIDFLAVTFNKVVLAPPRIPKRKKNLKKPHRKGILTKCRIHSTTSPLLCSMLSSATPLPVSK
jgi:hypothetical protein